MIAVWFSCGVASAVAAKETIRLFGTREAIRILNTPILEEDEDNARFMRDIEKWLGVKIETVVNPKYPLSSARQIWRERKFMSGPKGAPCTGELKKGARQHWERYNHPDWHVLGFTYDEQLRHERFVKTERDNVIPVLIESRITKQKCFDIISEAGIELPRIYRMGFANANCIGCVKATSPTYWNHVRKTHPDVFADRAKQSREIGCRLARVNNERVFLDELAPDAVGRSMESYNIDCGIFCEEVEK